MGTNVKAAATGWDVGGANLKAAQADAEGSILRAIELPCPLWRGLDRLIAALAESRAILLPCPRYAVTMTGEMADLFIDRSEGVSRLAAVMAAELAGSEFALYAGAEGFVAPSRAAELAPRIASANWHATAALLAGLCPAGLLVDIGTTTTDLIPFAGGKVRAVGFSDEQRLASGELVYSGVVRTPVMALAASVRFAGKRIGLMAEQFATTADLYRLTGALPVDADRHETADGRGKTLEESARRLARMIGRDAAAAPFATWRRLAEKLAQAQISRILRRSREVIARSVLPAEAPLIGAGVGRFLVPGLAQRLGRETRDIAELLPARQAAREAAARAAPASALALLALSAPFP